MSEDRVRHQLRWGPAPYQHYNRYRIADGGIGRYSCKLVSPGQVVAKVKSRAIEVHIARCLTMQEAMIQCEGHYWGGI